MSGGGKIKLRTAGDLISRLRWTTEEDCGQILIGYDDRINGPMEKSVADFKSVDEGGDIPQHRIQYFRRVTPEGARISNADMNRMILWDRQGRKDGVFGSGMGDVSASQATIQLAFDAIVNMKRIAEEQEIRRQEKAKQRARRQMRAGARAVAEQPESGFQQSKDVAEGSGDRHQWSNAGWYTYSDTQSSWKKGMSTRKQPKCKGKKASRQLRCVTWNVLFDEHGAETALFDGDIARDRWALAIRILEATKADLIALQEVTPAFVDLLCESQWVQDDYSVSAAPGAVTCVEPFGNLILWKQDALKVASPLGVSVLSDGLRKRSVVACLQSIQDPQTVFICASVHLPCDATGEDATRVSRATARRREFNAITAKLESLEQQLQAASSVSTVPIVMGDFNSDAMSLELEEGGFVNSRHTGIRGAATGAFADVWPLVSNGREGFTYDPQANERARHSTRGRRRIDRVFVGVGGEEAEPPLNPIDGKLIGVDSGDEGAFPPSDHYGVSISFSWEPEQLNQQRGKLESRNAWAGTALPTTDTLLALTLGEANEEHAPLCDPNSSLPAPHITLLNGFAELLSSESRDLAVRVVADAVTSIMGATSSCGIPFSADSLTVFEHRSSASLVCTPDSGCHWLENLYKTLRAAFRFCDEQESRFADGWTPHVTLGKFGTASEARNQANTMVSNGHWFQERCLIPAQAVVIYQRDPVDRKFYAVASVPLERKSHNLQVCQPRAFISDAGASLSSYYLKASAPFFSTIERVCQECIETLSDGHLEAKLQRYGSCQFMASLPGISDIDAIVDVSPRHQGAAANGKSAHQLISVSAYWQLVASRLQSIHKSAKIRMRIAGSNGVAIQFLTVRLCPQAPSVDLLLNLQQDANANNNNGVGSAAVSDSLKDGQQILNELRMHPSPDTVIPAFQGALRLCKLWAYRRQIYGASLGYLGGGGWALLVARAMRKGLSSGHLRLASSSEEGAAETNNSQRVLSYFFQETLQTWDQSIFQLREEGTPCGERLKDQILSRGTIAVLAPCSGENFARNATKSTVSTIFQELQRANRLLSSSKTGTHFDDLLFLPMKQEEILVKGTSILFLEISIGKLASLPLPPCLPEVKAWAACQMLQTLVALENELGNGVSVRPVSRPIRIQSGKHNKLLYIVTVAKDASYLESILQKRRESLRHNAEHFFQQSFDDDNEDNSSSVVQMKCLDAAAFQKELTSK